MFLYKKRKRKEKKMASSKVLSDISVLPEIQTKSIGFSSRPVTHLIKRLGTNDILVSQGKTEILTPQKLKNLGSETIKIRFSGVPRARMGEIIAEMNRDGASVYVRPLRSRSSRRIVYYDVFIVRDDNNEEE